jgi:hypothetical protein
VPIIEGTWTTKPAGVDDSYQRSTLDATKEVGRQLVGGAVVDLPRMVGQGLRWVSPPGSDTEKFGREMVDNADARATGYEPHNTGSGMVGRTLSMGARGIAPMAGVLAAGAVDPALGAVAGAALFGPGSAQDTEDKLRLQGVDDQTARMAGYGSGLVQGVGEGVAGGVASKLFKAGKLALGASPTMEGAVAALTSSAVLKPTAKAIGINMLVEPATEVAQDLGTEFVERNAGAKPEDAWELAKNSAQGAIGLTALLGPFAAGARMGHARRAKAIDAALNNPAAPLEIRQQAETMVMQKAAEAGVPQEQISAWQQQRAQARIAEPQEAASEPGADLLAGGSPAQAEAAQAAAATPPAQVAPPQAQTQVASAQVAPLAAAEVAPDVHAQQQADSDANAAATQAKLEQQARVNAHIEKIKADQVAKAEAEDVLGGTERDEKGKRSIKVPSRYTDTYLELKDAHANKLVDDAQFTEQRDRLVAALQTNDSKTLQAVRKQIDALRNPKPVVAKLEGKAAEKAAAVKAKAVEPVSAVIPAAPAPQPAGHTKAEPAPATAPVLPKFDNAADLADAVAKEHSLPQPVADVYNMRVLQGQKQKVVAEHFGIPESTVGDWVKRFTKLMDEASPTRLERSRATEQASPGEQVVEAAPGAATALPEAVAPDQQEGVDVGELHGDFAGGGDLADEANHNPYEGSADMGGGDSHINIADSGHGEGKTSADNNIEKDRRTTLAKLWTKLNESLPEDHRVEFSALGSAQQDTFDTEAKKGEKRAAKAHEVLSQVAHEGELYSGTIDSKGVSTLLGTPYTVTAIKAARRFEAVTTPTKDTYTMGDGEKIKIEPIGLNHPALAGAVHELTSHSEAGPFFTHAMQSIDQLVVYTADPLSTGSANEMDAFYNTGRNIIAVNSEGSLFPASQGTQAGRSLIVSTLAHELAHAADGAAARAYKIRDGLVSASQKSKTAISLTVENNKPMFDGSPLLRKAMAVLGKSQDRDLNDEETVLLSRLQYALDPLATAFDALAGTSAEKINEEWFNQLQEIENAEFHAATEIGPVLVQLRLEYPDLLHKTFPEGYAYANAIIAAESDLEVHNALVKDEHARTDSNGKAGNQAANTEQPSRTGERTQPSVLQEVRQAPATAAERDAGGAGGALPGRDRQERPQGRGDGAAQPARDSGVTTGAGFKAWFGDSKVVDDQGKPRVVYHGSNVTDGFGGTKPFDKFDKDKLGANTGASSAKLGFFFTDSLQNAAHYGGGGGMGNLSSFVENLQYMKDKLARMGEDNLLKYEVKSLKDGIARNEKVVQEAINSGRIMPTYLRIENPLEYDFQNKFFDNDTFTSVIARAKAEGYDGVILRNTRDPHDGTSYIVFEANQIKSPKNSGAFSRTDDRIHAAPRQDLPALDKPGALKKFAKSVTGDKLYRNFPSLLGALTTEQLADRFADHPLVEKFSSAMQKMGGMANNLIGEANPIVRDWAAAAKKHTAVETNNFGHLLLDATTKGMWPNKSFDDAAHDYLRPLRPDPKTASTQEMVEYHAKVAALEIEHGVLRKAWERTPAAFRELFPRIEKLNRDNFDRHVAADHKTIIDSYFPSESEHTMPARDEITKASMIIEKDARTAFLAERPRIESQIKRFKELWDSLDSHKSDYDNRLPGPYFPKSRFGEHVISYKSPEFAKAEKAVLDAKATLDKTLVDQREERDDLAAEVRTLQRKALRATKIDDKQRHETDLADALKRQRVVESSADKAKEALKVATRTLNDYKANDSHYAVEFYENREIAKTREAQLREHFKDGTEVDRATRDIFLLKTDGTTPAYAQRISDHLVGHLTGTDADEVRRTVREMYITHLPGSSALKNQMKRRNVPGVRAEESQRAFAAKATKDAYSISRKTFMGELHEHTNSLRYSAGANEDAKILGNELAKRVALNASLKTSKLISLATNATYFTQLGMSPGFMLMQATQQWINTAPMMAARHGVTTTTKNLAKGTADAAKMLKVSMTAAHSKMGFAVNIPSAVKAGLVTETEGKMLQDMFDRGRIDIASSHDAGIAAAGREQGVIARAAAISNWPVQQLEVINRISTALAGYRAELAKSKDEAAARKYADRLVSETHMSYAPENRARFIHPNSWGGWGRIMFQFRAYQQGMAYLTIKNLVDASRGNREALKALGYMAGVQLATAGMAGMPIPGAMAVVAALLYRSWGDDDEDRDLKEMFFQGLKTIGGETFAEAITHGVPAALGIDLSEKLGMGHTFDVAPFVRQTKDGRDMTAAYFMSIAGGAAGGQVANYAEAIHQATQGEFAKAAMMSLPRTFADILKAEEYQRVGLKDTRGNTILGTDDISGASTAIRMLGLTPTEVGRVQDERSAFFTARAARNDARAKLIATYAAAKLEGNDTEAVLRKIEGFNQRNPDDKIAKGALPVAVHKRKEFERNLKGGVPVGKRDRALYQDVLGE